MAAAELAGIHTTQTQGTKVTATAKTTVEVHTGHITIQHRAEAAPAVTAAGASPGHKPRNVETVNESIVETITKNEVTDIIRGLGYQAIPKDDEEFGEIIFSSSDGICWNIYLGYSGPFFDEIIITLFGSSKVAPLENINKWNLKSFALASLEINSKTNQILKKRDGTYLVTFTTRINLEGGVTINHIKCRLNEWLHEVSRISKLEDFIFLTPTKVTDNWSSSNGATLF